MSRINRFLTLAGSSGAVAKRGQQDLPADLFFFRPRNILLVQHIKHLRCRMCFYQFSARVIVGTPFLSGIEPYDHLIWERVSGIQDLSVQDGNTSFTRRD